MDNPNRQTIERLVAGDLDAFRALVEEYKRKIYFIAFDIVGDHQEAEDVSQEVFIKIYRALPKFRKDAKMSSWIYQITTNACIDVIRRRKSRPQVQLEDWGDSPLHGGVLGGASGREDPERSAEASLLRRRIDSALHRVSPRERVVFVMRHFNDFKICEIAEALAVSDGTVKSLLFRALRKLRKELKIHPEKPRLEVSYE
jgi:RNA polymerase sigma-70 factor (ECF subfamily)